MQGFSYTTTVLNLQLVIMVLEHQVPQGPSRGLAHPRVRTLQQRHESRDAS